MYLTILLSSKTKETSISQIIHDTIHYSGEYFYCTCLQHMPNNQGKCANCLASHRQTHFSYFCTSW